MNKFSEKSCVQANGAEPMHRNLQAGLVIALAALTGLGAAIPVFRDRLQDYFGLSTTRYGLLLNLGAFVGVAGALAGGTLMARIGPRRMLQLCLAGCIVGMSLAAWPGSWLLFLVALSVAAFFVAPLNFTVQAYLSALFPDGRRRILSLSMVASSLFHMIFPLVAEVLLSFTRPGHPSDFGRILHGLYAITGVMLLMGLVALRKDMPVRQAGAVEAASPAAAMPTGAIALLVALLTLHGAADTVLAVWMPRVLASASYAVQPFLPGAVMAAYALAYAVSRFILSLMPENRWRRRLMVLPGLLGGITLLAGILSRNQAWTAVAYVAGALLWSVECPVFVAALTEAGPRFGKAIAAFSVTWGVATFALGTSLGVLADRLGDGRLWQILVAPACGFPLAGLGGLCWVMKYGRAQFRGAR